MPTTRFGPPADRLQRFPARTVVTAGMAVATALTQFAVVLLRGGFASEVEGRDMGMRGAAEAFGEYTSTKLMPRLCQSTLRRLAISRRDIAAEHVDGDVVPDLEAEPSAIFFSGDTSGGPL